MQVTKKQLEEQTRQLQKENTLLLHGLNDMANDRRAFDVRQPLENGDTYRFVLTRPTSPCGGLLVIGYQQHGEDHFYWSVRYAEEALSTAADGIRSFPNEVWGTLEKVRSERWKILDRYAQVKAGN